MTNEWVCPSVAALFAEMSIPGLYYAADRLGIRPRLINGTRHYRVGDLVRLKAERAANPSKHIGRPSARTMLQRRLEGATK